MKIKNKTFETYKGKVYDLSVKDKNSYNVNGVAVHNSGAGSLVCYLTEITKVDPIKHGLLFERFLTRKKACLGIDSWVLCLDGPKQLKTLSVGDKVKTHKGIYSEVVAVDKTYDRTDWFEVSYGYRDAKPPVLGLRDYKHTNYVCGKLTCSANHKFVMVPTHKTHLGKVNPSIEHKSYDFVDAAETHEKVSATLQTCNYPRFYGVGSDNQTFEIISITKGKSPIPLIDIRLKEDHTFWVADKKDGVYVLSHNSLPDIDSDCADREEAIKILTEHFGEENVLPVISYNQLKLKSLIKDLSRLYKIPFEMINPLTQAIEQETLSKDKMAENFDRGVWVLTYESAIKHSPTFQQLMLDYPQLESSIKVLFKQDKSCFTADTLLLTNNGWKRFKNINEDVDHIAYIDNVGEVQFNKDYFKVTNGKKQVLKLTLDNGESLELTEDHLVETDNGWKEVKDLTVNDKLLGWI